MLVAARHRRRWRRSTRWSNGSHRRSSCFRPPSPTSTAARPSRRNRSASTSPAPATSPRRPRASAHVSCSSRPTTCSTARPAPTRRTRPTVDRSTSTAGTSSPPRTIVRDTVADHLIVRACGVYGYQATRQELRHGARPLRGRRRAHAGPERSVGHADARREPRRPPCASSRSRDIAASSTRSAPTT